jgi:hypothetical protein
MASGPWMVIGVDKTQTGSLDTFVNSTVPGQGYTKGQDCAFIGIPGAASPTSTSFWTSGSDLGGVGPNDDAMFTPYPSSSEGGKLYFVTPQVFNDVALTGSIPHRASWSDLQPGDDPSYVIVTPDDSSPYNFYRYSFTDIDDLITNGWRISDGAGNPLDKTKWDNLVTNADWNNVGLSPAGTTQEKEQIVACSLAGTPQAKSLSGGALTFKGAVLLAFGGTGGRDWGKTGYVVPFADANIP